MVRRSMISSISTGSRGLCTHNTRVPSGSITIHQMPELRQRAEKEFNYRSPARQLLHIDPPLQIVHEHLDIELVVAHLTARPSHPPLSKSKNDWLEFFAGSSGMIFDSPLIGDRFPDNETGLFKLVEAFGQ